MFPDNWFVAIYSVHNFEGGGFSQLTPQMLGGVGRITLDERELTQGQGASEK